MSFNFTCPFCLNSSRVAEEYLGQNGPCASCGKPVRMPTRDGQGRLVQAVQTGKPIGPKGAGTSQPASPREDRSLLRAIVGISGLMLLLLLVTGIFVGLPILRKQMRITARNSDLARMKSIVTALNIYCDKYGSYPPTNTVDATGKPLLSWRVLILPFLGYGDLYDKFRLDQSWDSPLNLSLVKDMPREFCSSNSPDAWGNKQPNYVLLVGKNSLFPPSGPLGRKQVTDNPTLLVVETLNGIPVWTEPGDIDLSVSGAAFGNLPMQSIGGLHSDVALGVDTQGQSVIIPRSTSTTELEALITPSAGEAIASKEWTLHP